MCCGCYVINVMFWPKLQLCDLRVSKLALIFCPKLLLSNGVLRGDSGRVGVYCVWLYWFEAWRTLCLFLVCWEPAPNTPIASRTPSSLHLVYVGTKASARRGPSRSCRVWPKILLLRVVGRDSQFTPKGATEISYLPVWYTVSSGCQFGRCGRSISCLGPNSVV